MIALRPRSSPSRALALTVLAALIGAIWLGVIDPIRTRYLEKAQALAAGAELLARLRSSVATGRRAGAADEAGLLDRYRSDFLAGVEDAIVVADLQTRLGTLATARRAEVASARGLPMKSREGLEYLGLRLMLRGEMQSLQQVLYAFETMTPLLFVERAALRLDNRAAGSSDPHGEAVAPMTLEIDVYGAKWPSPAPAPGAAKPR
jgi:type II secretion system (T2SS) protein M